MRDEDYLNRMIRLDKRILAQDLKIDDIRWTQDKLNDVTQVESNRLGQMDILLKAMDDKIQDLRDRKVEQNDYNK